MDNKDEKTRPEKTNLCWHFPDLDHGQSDGLNDPTLQYFEGNHEMYIAREAIQNSIDARLDQNSPIIVEFEKRIMHSDKLPGRDELLERVQKCLEKSELNEDEKGVEYFTLATSILQSKEITLLRIGDYNTIGLDGDDDNESGRWYRLVKSVGENRMTGVGGGSFGIGKGAPIAASNIRTVYYSTRNEKESIFQGCARLITHEFDKKKRRGMGYWGTDGYKSLRGDSKIPDEFLRRERGTDVFIVAYDPSKDDWRSALVESVLENFWMAIHTKDLEVKFADDTETLSIDSKTLSENLKKYTQDSAYQYYQAVIKPTRKEEKNLPTIGNCELYIKQDPNLVKLKSVALMRKPKMVVERRKFKMQDGYAGVFICDDDNGNRILRDMEPPEHDKWDEDRYKDKAKGKKILREMYDWVREILREMANTEDGNPEEIDGLDKYLPYEDDADLSGGSINVQLSENAFANESPVEVGVERDEEYDEIDDIVQKPTIIAKKKQGRGNEYTKTKGGNGIEGNRSGEGDKLSRINTADIKFRIMVANRNGNEMEYCLILDPVYDQDGSVNIVAVGDDRNYPMQLVYAKNWDNGKDYPVSGSSIKEISLYKGERTKIKICIHSNTKYALGIEKYES